MARTRKKPADSEAEIEGAAQATVPSDPAAQVELWAIERLIPYARNTRMHSDAQVAQIAASMREWGWTTPCLVDEEGTLIAGHGRVLAARQIGREQVPVMIARGWTESKKRAYRIADNQLALSSSWDSEMLAVELKDLSDDEFELPLLGFPDAELEALLRGWASDINPAEKDGEHLDGIDASFRVVVSQDDRDRAREVIEQALAAEEIKYELR